MKPITRPCAFCGKSVTRKSPGKQRSFCDNKCKSEFQRLAKPVTKEWLIQKYSVERLDCTQISKMVDRDSKSVWNWLKDFGIPTRPRGSRKLRKGLVQKRKYASLQRKETPQKYKRKN